MGCETQEVKTTNTSAFGPGELGERGQHEFRLGSVMPLYIGAWARKQDLNRCVFKFLPYHLLLLFNCRRFKFVIFFVYLWLCWVFTSAGLSTLAVVSRGTRCWLQPTGFSLQWLLFQSPGSRAGSASVVHGLSCFTAREIFPDQGLHAFLLHLAGGFTNHWATGEPILATF